MANATVENRVNLEMTIQEAHSVRVALHNYMQGLTNDKAPVRAKAGHLADVAGALNSLDLGQ